MLAITLTFLVIDAYYFTWVLSLKGKLPPDMACFVSDAVLGYTKKMSRELKYNLDKGARAGIETAKNKLRQKQDQRKTMEREAQEQRAKEAEQNKKKEAQAKAQQKD